jgi:predicted secreted acid phosphatase
MTHVRRSMLAVAAVLVAISIFGACASTPEAKQYQAISTCNATAQAATRAFGVLYQQHKAEDPALWADRYDKAAAAYASYQKIALAAVDAAQSGGDQTLVLAAVNEALNQLTVLLATFGVK